VGELEEAAEVELNEGSMTLDTEVDSLLKEGNMEQLAALVLNGEGRRLVGRQSGNPELQAFIDNVPSYMVRRRVDDSFGTSRGTVCNAMFCVTSGQDSCRAHGGARGKPS